MKNLLTLVLGLGLSSFAMADYNANVQVHDRDYGYGGGNGLRGCIAQLKTRRGRVLATFPARKCRRARRQCQRELQRRHQMGRNPYAYCDISGAGYGGEYPGHPPGGGYGYVTKVCYVDRVTSYNSHISTHPGVATAFSNHEAKRQACAQAIKQCRLYSSYGQRCVRRDGQGNGHGGGYNNVSASCSYEVRGRRGRLIDTVISNAVGVTYYSAQALACNSARNKCARRKRDLGRPHASCTRGY